MGAQRLMGMDQIEREILFNRIRAWVLDAGAIIRDKINDPWTVSTKSNPKDLVTEMDRAVEFFFAKKIKTFYQDHLLLGEEGYGDSDINKMDTVWIIDPIDGTMNFVHQKQNFAISLGVYHQGVGEIGIIYDVMNNNLYSALRGNGAYKNNKKLAPLKETKLTLNESIICFSHRWLMENDYVDEKVMQRLVHDVRGVRSYGSASLDIARVAEGVLDAYITMSLEPWDIAAGKVIVEEVGGIITDIEGKEIGVLERSSVVTAHPDIHEKIVQKYLIGAIKKSK